MNKPRILLALLAVLGLSADALAQTTPYVASGNRGTTLPSTVLDVKASYGAQCNDVADDTNAIQAAVARAIVLGGAVILIPGICRVSTTIQVNGSNITFLGVNPYASQIKTTSATAPVLVFGDGTNSYSFNYVQNVGVTASVSRSAGAGVKFSKIGVGGYYGGYVANQFTGVEISGGSGLIKLNDLRIVDPTATTGAAVVIDNAVEAQLSNLAIACNQTYPAYAGVWVKEASGLRFENVDSVYCGIGLALLPSSSKTIEHIFSSRSSWDSSGTHGILMQAASGTTIRRATFVGDWTATSGDNGVVTTGTGTIDGIEFIGHRSVNNANSGMIFLAGTNIAIDGGLFSGNSTASSGTKDGILFSGVSAFRVRGVRSGQTNGYSNTQRYGIAIDNAASDNYVVTDSDVRTNATAGMLLASAIGVTRQVARNLGYITSANGIGSGLTTDGSGDVTITHGLAGTPVEVWAQMKGTTAAYILNPHTYGATTFKIRVFDAAGAAVLTTAIDPIAWKAEQ
jgi:hypothetical protein